ncbi:MAG: site-specific DNA-methyltransferase [Kiritimatiellaeota bacterium]|nr:site-specific DNA-methyltransferase [Kiritimatiellota bacterium]
MKLKPKLELTWIGKENRPRLEPRILLEDPEKSYHAAHRMTDHDLFDNRLIFGDNLLALKALEQEFTGQIKCICIDPPYNTGSAFEHYDDGIEHSLWLSMMRDRLEMLFKLLNPSGSVWATLDDNEAHYFKVLADEVFGRANFLGNIVWQSKDTPGNNSSGIAQTHNHIFAYRKSEAFQPKLLIRNEKQIANYTNPDNDPRGPWLGTPLTRAEHRDRDYYQLQNPAGRNVLPPKGSSWRRPPDKIKELLADKRIYWGKDGNAEFPVEKKFLSEVKEGIVNQTWWPYDFAGSTRNASAEMKGLFEGTKAFDTPKPEKLVQRIIDLSTNPGDIVLDSFAGSGTTGAVAHKMGRRWIMVELGEHCHTHIIPRLKKVIDGTDPGGITEAVNWKGGGGFRYYRLAPSLLEKDKWGQWVISKEFNAAMLAEAVCKLEGFTYAPSDTVYWQHGHSTERDFIYVTTQHLSADQLAQLSDEVGPDRTLLVLCAAFRVLKDGTERYPNLTVKKIPKQVLSRCEWGHDDYSLKVENLPKAPPKPGQMGLFGEEDA